MKYIVFKKNGLIEHVQSGIAHNKHHVHETRTMKETELMFIISGEILIHHLEDYCLKKNDLFLLPGGIKHYGIKATDCVLHWHHFYLPSDAKIIEEDEIEEYRKKKNYYILPIKFSTNFPEYVLTLSYQLEQYDYKRTATKRIRDLLLTTIIEEFSLENTDNVLTFKNKRFNAMVSYIDNNFLHFDIQISDLAEKFGYSEKYIYMLFKQYLGISPLKYILKMKMAEAKEMLLNTDDTIESIAFSLNYNSAEYFMRQFKEFYNMTPTKMRLIYSNSMELFLKTK